MCGCVAERGVEPAALRVSWGAQRNRNVDLFPLMSVLVLLDLPWESRVSAPGGGGCRGSGHPSSCSSAWPHTGCPALSSAPLTHRPHDLGCPCLPCILRLGQDPGRVGPPAPAAHPQPQAGALSAGWGHSQATASLGVVCHGMLARPRGEEPGPRPSRAGDRQAHSRER